MEEQLISFETANLASDKGFKVECDYFYNRNSNYKLQNDSIIRTGDDLIYEAPTQSLLQKWLREKHKLSVLCHVWNGVLAHYCIIALIPGEENIRTAIYDTYEEALEEGLLRALKSIKSV